MVYCAHDAIFARQIIDDFEQQTGLDVWVRYDTEATKSLGLVNLLLSEKSNPQCDVFWNNQLLGTLELAENGVLEPYQGEGAQRIPAQFKNEYGLWTGFAARLRLLVRHPDQSETPFDPALDVASPDFALAKPMFGTTLSHFSLLAKVQGVEALKQWYDQAVEKGCRVVAGNSQVRDVVAHGGALWGYTDTDDYLVAIERGEELIAEPVRVEGKTICIPNTVGIINGTRKREAAEKLVDYLLSEQVERKLANSDAGQIPLGPTDRDSLPEQVQQFANWAEQSHDLRDLLPFRRDVLNWLTNTSH